ncbi:MAG: hypothetical protein LBI56_03635 [Puniceicoccales bacterium]|jgi:hypothetical protein|nr:hypothetical protein [Puniceicoccales bacterium]
MLRIFFISSLLTAACICGGCISFDDAPKGGAPRTSVDMQSMQTREFYCSYKVAFASVIDVFQDLGFVIQTSDSAIGLVIAKSSVTSRESHRFRFDNSPFLNLPDSESSWDMGTAHVEELSDNRISIRVSFVANKRTSYEYGSSNEKSFAVTDARFYTNFFEKIDKSIFVRQGIKTRQ